MRKTWFQIPLFIASLVIAAGCGQDNVVDKEKTEPVAAGREFNAKEVVTGDKVAGLEIVEINVGQLEGAPENDYTANVKFKGELKVSGDYVYHDDSHEYHPNSICFTPDSQSEKLFPKIDIDERNIWFCFENHDFAAESFGPAGSKGTAEISIENYIINFIPTEITNLATLVHVHSKEQENIAAPAQQPVVLENEAFKITSPTSSQEIQRSVILSGQARVFEATFQYRLEDGHNVLAEGFVTTTEGAPEWGSFNVEIEFLEPTSPHGVLQIYEESAEDGTPRHELQIPVTFKNANLQ